MGVQLTPSVLNNHCVRCFPLDETPDTLIVFVGGMLIGDLWTTGDPMPPNGKCYLTQTPVTCEWTGSNSIMYQVFLRWNAFSSQLSIEVEADFFAFVESPSGTCHRFFTNARINPAIFAYYSGWAVVFTPAEIAIVLEQIVPVDDIDPRFEVYPGPGGIVDIRYASRKLRQNITVQIPAP